jgi:hypothetical protein
VSYAAHKPRRHAVASSFFLRQSIWFTSALAADDGAYGEAMDANPESRNTTPLQPVKVAPGPRFRVALLLAVLADALQIAILPIFIEGAESPAADAVDLVMAGVLYFLLGWHWEFLPSFAGKLIPGVDLAPLWTLAVANVYRKSKRGIVNGNPPR